MSLADQQLDITAEDCPMTFVRTKLCLERMEDGQILQVRLREGEASRNVPRAVTDHGHEILGWERETADILLLKVRKAGSRRR